ncbi:MAG: hypothetical protein ACXVBE_16910 [Bdellovibrionota bacterium]
MGKFIFLLSVIWFGLNGQTSAAVQGMPICKVFLKNRGEFVQIYVRDNHLRSIGTDPDKLPQDGFFQKFLTFDKAFREAVSGPEATISQRSMEWVLTEYRRQGICHGIYIESAKNGQTEPSADFLKYDEPKLAMPSVAPPTQPKMVELRDQKNFLVGGMSEVVPGKGVYITNRHVLAGQPYSDIEKSLKEAGIKFGDMTCYRFFKRFQNYRGAPEELQELDMVLLVPKNSDVVTVIPAPEELLNGCNVTDALEKEPLHLRLNGTGTHHAQLGDDYYTYQYSWVGDNETKSVSTGTIAFEDFRSIFYLPPSDFIHQNNRSTLRGSGSLVFSRQGTEEWKPSGILECEVPPVKKKGSIETPGAVRVIPLDNISSTIAVKANCAAPEILGPTHSQENCVPINGRGGGGE